MDADGHLLLAKCAFSVLLLLKLARLLPPPSTNTSQLIKSSKLLLQHLSQIPGSNNIYFRILSLSVEKCEKALRGDFPHVDSRGEIRGQEEGFVAEMEFQSYVPREFILEWNFPGLTFCWIPFDFGELFGDLAVNANGASSLGTGTGGGNGSGSTFTS